MGKGKHGRKQRRRRKEGISSFSGNEEDYEEMFPLEKALFRTPNEQDASDDQENDDRAQEGEMDDNEFQRNLSTGDLPSKFSLYQQSVQSPKGDISYLRKFFLMYVGGRVPFHLQEDFCGTALLSTEWLRADARRTAVGLDLDDEALVWCMKNNVNKIGADVYSRLFLFHGNVLEPLEARLVNFNPQDIGQRITLEDNVDASKTGSEFTSENYSTDVPKLMLETQLPARDIVCAFNYSCCCLHTRKELVSYFKHAHSVLNKEGAIFVMDLYGGASSEWELRLQRRFPNFTYIWEQAGFDIIQHKTRVSLHYYLQNLGKKIRHAFSYSWRLWSLPEVRDCLEEAGFRSVHFWIRTMPNSEEMKSVKGFGVERDIKYEEVTSFQQVDSWNAYVVAVV